MKEHKVNHKRNRLEEFKALQLMCQALDKVIDLHRDGYERYDAVLDRAFMLKRYIETLIDMNASQSLSVLNSPQMGSNHRKETGGSSRLDSVELPEDINNSIKKELDKNYAKDEGHAK